VPSATAIFDADLRHAVSPSDGALTRGAARTPDGPRLIRGASRLLVGLVLSIAGITAPSAVMAAEELTFPPVTGTSIVGRTELALTDAGRSDPFATDGNPRELAVWIWYPAVEGSTGTAAPYLPPTWADLVNSAGVVSRDLNTVRTSAIAGAQLEGQPPVVVLLPGLGQPVAAYSALAEDLASHGYAVVGINPTGSGLVVFPDGHVVAPTDLGGIDPALSSDVPGWYAAAERIADVWAADAAFVTETLAASPPAIGALDFDHVAYVGHSMGGAAAFEACRQDERCAAAVDLDGTLWTDVRQTGLTVRNLVLRHDQSGECDGFCEAANTDFATVEAAGHSQQYAIAGSQHMDFSDLGLLRGPDDTLLPVGPIDAERMTLITRDLVRSFLDEHLGRASAGTLADAVARYPELS
jgi:pimeloyl-ACP methyl ester carboxylesterase